MMGWREKGQDPCMLAGFFALEKRRWKRSQRKLTQSSANIRRRRWHPTPVLLPGKSHGQRTLVVCGPWGREELDMTERLPFHFSLSCIGEGNGNPLQRSCLENPRDGGAWWAAVYGVTQSWTWLKWLSSSSSSSANIVRFFIELKGTRIMALLIMQSWN